MTDTQTIKDRIDLVQFIQEYLPLKKTGANWKANCPFHQEKSPSFMVHPEKQIWHCFGCSKGGDIFTFVQEMEGLGFPETLKMLADRAGVKIDVKNSEIKNSQRNRLLEITKKAAYFFHNFLLEVPANKPARDYLEQRGLKPGTIIDWQIGFSPDQWDLLTKYLVKHGFLINDLVDAGLTIKKQDEHSGSVRYYDRFRGRIMFPLSDVHGNVVGFTGRILVEKPDTGGKYINSPQTMLYDKSRMLYGLHKAKTNIKIRNKVLIVEGQMDVVTSHQEGMGYVVAASGTALTGEQVRLLKRYTTEIIMAFDGDNAGENAGKRGIEVAVEEGMHVKVVKIPAGLGKDADECIKKDKKKWFDCVEHAVDSMDWYFDVAANHLNSNDPRSKQKASEFLLGHIARIPHVVEQEHWLEKLAQLIFIDTSILREELVKIRNKPKQQSHYNDRNNKAVVLKKPDVTDSYTFLVQMFWSLLCKFPALYASFQKDIRAEYFEETTLKSLYEIWQRYYNKPAFTIKDVSLGFLQANLEDMTDFLLMLADKEYEEITSKDAAEELAKLLQRISLEWTKKRRKFIEFSLKKSEKEKNVTETTRLLHYLQSL
jgi:DNA primase